MTEKQFTECEYFRYSDNIWTLGYCINPIQHKKINGIALLGCQGSACELDTKKKWKELK